MVFGCTWQAMAFQTGSETQNVTAPALMATKRREKKRKKENEEEISNQQAENKKEKEKNMQGMHVDRAKKTAHGLLDRVEFDQAMLFWL